MQISIVEAYDVRSAIKDQIKSLGAKFVDTGVSAEGAGGYARELTADEKKKQQEVLDSRIAAADVVVTTAALAAAVVGAYDSVTVVDEIIFAGGDAATLLIQKGGIFDGDFSYYLAGIAVYLIVGLTAIYTIFLLALSRIALSVLLALGPLFIALLLFESTKRFFESWVAQLANYALINILTVLVAALMMSLVSTAAEQAADTGGGIEIAHAVRVCMAAGLTFLVMRQVMPMAAGIASGLALSTYGAMSTAMAWALGSTTRTTGQFMRGAVMDRDTTRWDSLSRKAGHQLQRAARGLLARRWR